MTATTSYKRTAFIKRFRDGDTLEVHAQCVFCHCIQPITVRLPRIDSWEPNGIDSAKAKLVARTLTELYQGKSGPLVEGKPRSDKYGRTVADILIGAELLSNILVRNGYAWFGIGAPEPVDMQPMQI